MTHPLSPLEHCIFNFDQAAIFNFFVMAKIQGQLPVDVLRQAIDKVQQKHYYLQVSILTSEIERPHFVFHDRASMPLQQLTLSNDTDCFWQAEQELNQRFDLTCAPLARACLLNTSKSENSLLFTFSHIIADGMAGVLFVRDVLDCCGQLLQGHPISDLTHIPTLSPTEELFPVNSFIPPTPPNLPDPLTGRKPVVPLSERRTHFIHRLFSAEDTQLRSKCRQENTTVQGALVAALLLAIQEKMYSELNSQPPVTIVCNSPINLRRYYHSSRPIPEEQMGFWIGLGKTTHCLTKDTSFWELAREVRLKLTQYIDSNACFTAFKTLADHLDQSPLEFTQQYEYRTPYLMISNLGDLDPKIPHTFGPLTLTDLHFGVGRHYCHSSEWSFSVTANTFCGQLATNFLYVEPFLNQQEADHIVQSCLDKIYGATFSFASTFNV